MATADVIFEFRGALTEPWMEVERFNDPAFATEGKYFDVFAGSYGPNASTTATVDNVRIGDCGL